MSGHHASISLQQPHHRHLNRLLVIMNSCKEKTMTSSEELIHSCSASFFEFIVILSITFKGIYVPWSIQIYDGDEAHNFMHVRCNKALLCIPPTIVYELVGPVDVSGMQASLCTKIAKGSEPFLLYIIRIPCCMWFQIIPSVPDQYTLDWYHIVRSLSVMEVW